MPGLSNSHIERILRNIIMHSYKFYCTPNLIKVLLAFLFIILSSGHSFAANYALEIIQPQPNLDTKNRFYKAYPSLEYNVRLAVAGGAFPYKFSLAKAPSGMTIDKRGEISWPDPIGSGTPYPVTATVTDSQGSMKSVSWTITVTTTGFLFVDAIKGKTAAQGGTGTLANPWKTMKDVYGGDTYDDKWTNHHPGEFVYWRAGTYILDTYYEDCGGEGCRIPWSGRKPVVWLAYPTETPEINFSGVSNDAFIFFYDKVANLYLDGFDFNINSNTRGKGVQIGNNGNITIRNNTFRGVTLCGQQGGNNSLLFLSGGTGEFTSIQDNVAYDSCGYWLLGYDSPKTIVENNTITTNIKLPISPKDNIQHWTIRGNHIQGQTTSGAIYAQEYNYSSDIEICFNLIQMTGSDGLALKLLSSDPGGPMHVYRNTIIGHVDIINLNANKGPWTFSENVIINNSSSPDKMTRVNSVDETRLIKDNNLLGSPTEIIVDSQGYLTGAYTSYVGTRGFEIGIRPKPPTLINVAFQ